MWAWRVVADAIAKYKMSQIYCYCLNVVVNYSGQLGTSEVIKCQELAKDLPDNLQDKELLQSITVDSISSVGILVFESY